MSEKGKKGKSLWVEYKYEGEITKPLNNIQTKTLKNIQISHLLEREREINEDDTKEFGRGYTMLRLKRLRSTCKEWNSLFKDDKRFQRMHSDKAAKQFLVLMLKNFMICPMRVNLHGTIPSVEVISELSIVDSHDSAQFDIYRVFLCDGLLLCTSLNETRVVVWNPLTGETRWIKADMNNYRTFVMGYYQDKKSCNKSYKILSFDHFTKGSNIYEFSSDSWRNLGGTGYYLAYLDDSSVSLNGDTYFIAANETKAYLFLRFDFSTEKSTPLPLPYDYEWDHQYLAPISLSVVRQEKLSLLLQCDDTSKAEIWVTNNFDETSVVSWNKVLTLDLSSGHQISDSASFLLDEEKEVVISCDRRKDNSDSNNKDMVSIIGEDNKVTDVLRF